MHRNVCKYGQEQTLDDLDCELWNLEHCKPPVTKLVTKTQCGNLVTKAPLQSALAIIATCKDMSTTTTLVIITANANDQLL